MLVQSKRRIVFMNSPSSESTNRSSNGCNKRLLLSQGSAGLETSHGVVCNPECWAEDAGCHCGFGLRS